MSKRTIALIGLLLSCSFSVVAQKGDTIRIDPSKVTTKVLLTGTHRYLVYFKLNKQATRTLTQFWTRSIERSEMDGKAVITIKQEWEDKDSIVHTTTSVCDAVTMQPLLHTSWWKGRGITQADYRSNTLMYNGNTVTDADTAKNLKSMYTAFKSVKDKYSLNWHLDLEIFPILPYKKGVTFLVPFYDPGTGSPLKEVAYTVTGSAFLNGYDGQQIDCWLLLHETKGNKEVFWISKKTKEVLKLEQEFGGQGARYKIKFAYSN